MHNGSTITSSIVKALEDTFFRLEDLAFRAAPGVGDIIPRGSGRDPVFRVAFCGIVNPVTFKTDPSGIFGIGWHRTATPFRQN